MTAFQVFLTETAAGELLYTALMAMAPVVELRGAIPFGHNVLGLGIWPTFCAAVVGNLLPVPFLIIYIRRVFAFLRRKLPGLNSLLGRLEQKAAGKEDLIRRYGMWGLFILVAIPLPGTGAWMGSLVAALMDLRLKKALPIIALGVAAAGLVITFLTYGFTALLF